MDRPADKPTRELQSPDTQNNNLVSQLEATEEIVVPVLKEELEFHKERRKTGTVRVSKTVHESEEAINESLVSETVDIERVPVDLIVDRPPEVRMEGDVTIIPVVKEEIIVTKQLRVVEELRVTKRRSVSEYRESVKVQAEEVAIERVPSENLKTKTGTA